VKFCSRRGWEGPARTSDFCENCQNWEYCKNLQKIPNFVESVKTTRRRGWECCDETCDYCENCQKLRSLLNLGKILRFVESVKTCIWRGLEGPDKICDFYKICENFEYFEMWEKLKDSSSKWKPVEQGLERTHTRTSMFVKIDNIVKSSKNFKLRGVSENLLKEK